MKDRKTPTEGKIWVAVRKSSDGVEWFDTASIRGTKGSCQSSVMSANQKYYDPDPVVRITKAFIVEKED